MKRLIIEGGHQLRGRVRIQGSKNATQKILPATVVFPGEYVVRNIPRISDSADLIAILQFLGARVQYIAEHDLLVDTTAVSANEIPPDVADRSTGSFLFAGALLSRCGEAKVWHPGGDRIGARPITWHLDAFRKLGAQVLEQTAFYRVQGSRLCGATIDFPRTTVNGTVNAILAAVRAQGTTLLCNAAPDPDIDNLIAFMNSAGARVARIEDRTIRIDGVYQGVGRAEIDVVPDRNDTATFAIVAALCSGPITLELAASKHLDPLVQALRAVGATVEADQTVTGNLRVSSGQLLPTALAITSRPYPGFSTDWGPMIQVLMTQVPATSVFHETIFSERFKHLPHLVRMGAHLEYFNPDVHEAVYNFPFDPSSGLLHAVRIAGPTCLQARDVSATDVRAGAALTLAGLVASGTTTLTGVEQIDRGYERFAARLKDLGAHIEEA